LFPTAVAKFDLNRQLEENELQFTRKLLHEFPKPNVGNTTSAIDSVLEYEQLSRLKAFAVDALNSYASDVMSWPNIQMGLTQSWLNLSVKGQWHHEHSHGNSVLSGTLYLVVSEQDRIVFHRPQGAVDVFHHSPRDWNGYNSTNWWFSVTAGMILVWPSWLRHSVPPTESCERISLSFNSFPTSSFGCSQSKTHLGVGVLPRFT
jgi:uncharacterized protein (TIGR02466 family)